MAGTPALPRPRLRADAETPRLARRGGDPESAAAVVPLVRDLLRKGDTVQVLREKPGRRRLARGALASGDVCFLKQFQGSGRWKRRLGLGPAAREFRSARRLRAAGVAVPEALAWFESERGDEVLVSRFLEGEPLGTALGRAHPARRELLRRVGELVASLHAAGVVHRDLHGENVWVTADGPVLIDLQQALPARVGWLRLRDLAELDDSLAPVLSLPDRLRLRAAALGLSRPYDRPARASLRAVGRASLERRRAHVESRTRRSLRAGRLYARFRCDEGRGMRMRKEDEDVLRRDLERSTLLQRFRSPIWRPGSPARDAWLAGHGLRARGIGAPLPRAFVERRGPRQVASTLWLEPADEARPGDASDWTGEVVELGLALRRHHVVIGPDRGLLRDARGRLGPVGLEQVRFPRRLRPEQAERIDRLVERAVAAAGEELGAVALRRYAARLSFYDAETVTQRK